MRHEVALLFVIAAAAPGLRAEGYGPGLTVLLDFQEAASQESFTAMQREVRKLLEPSGLRVQLRLSSEFTTGETSGRLVLMKVKGRCAAPVDPMLLDERGPGPMAFAHTNSGEVQPFAEVACDSVRRAVESALWGGQRGKREQLFGRALGRVVAHELVHMVAQTDVHGKTGVFRPSLSGAQLIGEHAEFSPDDIHRVEQALGMRGPSDSRASETPLTSERQPQSELELP